MVGDAVRSLALALRQLSKVQAQIAAPLATFIQADLRRTAAAETDPYGNAFAALRPATIRRKGHSRILYEGGALQGSLNAFPLQGAGVGLSVGPAYAYYHINGTPNMVARPFFPRSGMPKAWNAEVRRLTQEALNAAVK